MIKHRAYQVRAIPALVGCRRGILKAPAGSGKTVMGADAASRWAAPRAKLARRRQRIAIVANTTEQCDQWRRACGLFDSLEVSAEITICCYASGLGLAGFDLVIFDECHHIAAPEYRKMLEGHVGWRWGVSATPNREDECEGDVFELIGPIVCEISRDEVRAEGGITEARVIIHQPNEKNEIVRPVDGLAEKYFKKWKKGAPMLAKKLCRDSLSKVAQYRKKERAERLHEICKAGNGAWSSSVNTLLLRFPKGSPLRKELWEMMVEFTEDSLMDRARWTACLELGVFRNYKRTAKCLSIIREHLSDSLLAVIGKVDHGTEMAGQVPGSVVIHSEMTKKASGMTRKEALAAFTDRTVKTAFVTSLADEGLDLPVASVMVLCAAGRSSRLAEQRTGRVLRAFHDKTHGTIHDFMDIHHPLLLTQSRRRIATYRTLGYSIEFSQGEGVLL